MDVVIDGSNCFAKYTKFTPNLYEIYIKPEVMSYTRRLHC